MTNADTPESLSSTDPDPDGALAGHSGAEAAETVPDQAPPRRRRRRWWGVGIGAVLLLGAILGFLFVPTPYVLIQPGAVRPAEERIEVVGAESFEADGNIMFTTVYVDQATLFGLMRGSFDDAIEVRTQEEVYGDRGRDETQEVNRQKMDLSKLIATMEALSLLGYETEFSAEGAHVLAVTDDAPAASVLEPGDVIVAVDGNAIQLPSDLRTELAGKAPGDEVSLSIRRPVPPSGESASAGAPETESLEVTAALTSVELEPEVTPEPGGSTQPDSTEPDSAEPDSAEPDSTEPEATGAQDRAVLGVSVEPWNPTVDSEVQVEIDSGTVTGPSAGLAWALAVIDTLTPEQLTGGRDVAVTGEILADGSIGVIGGVEQKVATVARNGIEVFIYPADTPESEQQEMRRIAGDDVELVPVVDLSEAVEYLSPGLLEQSD